MRIRIRIGRGAPTIGAPLWGFAYSLAPIYFHGGLKNNTRFRVRALRPNTVAWLMRLPSSLGFNTCLRSFIFLFPLLLFGAIILVLPFLLLTRYFMHVQNISRSISTLFVKRWLPNLFKFGSFARRISLPIFSQKD